MKPYWETKKIATLLNVTDRAIQKRAIREKWPKKEIPGRGRGGKKFVFLPDFIEILDDDEKIVFIKKDNTRVCCEAQEKKQNAKADLLRLYLTSLKSAKWGNKVKVRKKFMMAYNTGIAYPRIFEILGKVNWKTIEGWKRNVSEQGDITALADRRGYVRLGKRGLSEDHKKILLRCALHPNRPKLSEVIRMAEAVMETRGIPINISGATFRRFLNDWKSTHYDIWVFSREGAKAWNDKVAFYIERDYNLINVGDVLVADGHILNFEILNPWTGKPKRMVLILWYDMKSNFPLGWEIMPTESTQAIASSLRRAILRLGKYPQVAYMDNGKAFGARFFKGVDFDQEGFAGLFERLGTKTIFAWPYHGQSKTIEQFFKTFGELERWCPTYVGTSIDKKPPRLMRGEKLHRRVYEKLINGNCITLEQAHRAIASWFDMYAQRPQRGHLEGRAPMDVFLEEKGPGIDPVELRYLMMSMDIRHIRRNGITFLGQNYYDPALHRRRHPVLIRYDLQDRDAIYVFERDGSFLCEARIPEKAHPAATHLGTDEDRARLKKLIEHKKSQEKEASVLARTFLEEEVIPEHRRQLESAGISTEGSQQPDKKVKQIPAKLTAKDEEKILAEVRELQGLNRDDASDLRAELEKLNDLDRYEKLLEMEVAKVLISKQWEAFMRFFEMTPQFERHRDYFDERRVKLATAYQVNSN